MFADVDYVLLGALAFGALQRVEVSPTPAIEKYIKAIAIIGGAP
ncbi:MAG: hypothetical protein WEC75_03870 [Dehalococcoidia bacterium]